MNVISCINVLVLQDTGLVLPDANRLANKESRVHNIKEVGGLVGV